MTGIPRSRTRYLRDEMVNTALWYSISYNRDFRKEVMTDYVVKNFRSLSKSGEVIINPLSYSCEVRYLPNDTITWQSTGYPPATADKSGSANYMRGCLGYVPQNADWRNGVVSGSLPGYATSSNDTAEFDLRKQAAMAFVDKPQYDFGEDLLSIRETLRFLRNPLESIYHLFTAFGKRASAIENGKQYASSIAKARAIAELWATYSFSIRPLIQSCENAIKALEDETVLPFRRTSRSKSVLTQTTVRTYSGSHTSGNYMTAVVTNVRTADFHVGVVYDAPQRVSLQSKLGLRLKDWPTTLWEVIPMSFMVDRMMNIKNFILGLVNLNDPEVKIKGGFLVKRQRDSHTVLATSLRPPKGTAILAFSPLPHYHEYFLMTREKWIPNVSDTLPLWNPKELVKDLTRVADLLALIVLIASPLTKSTLPVALRR